MVEGGDINYYDLEVEVGREVFVEKRAGDEEVGDEVEGWCGVYYYWDAEADEWSKPVMKKAEMKIMRMKMVELLVSMVMMWLEVEKNTIKRMKDKFDLTS